MLSRKSFSLCYIINIWQKNDPQKEQKNYFKIIECSFSLTRLLHLMEKILPRFSQKNEKAGRDIVLQLTRTAIKTKRNGMMGRGKTIPIKGKVKETMPNIYP